MGKRPAVLAGAIAACTCIHGFAAERDYQRATDASGNFKVNAVYENFNRDPLTFGFTLAQDAVKEATEEFGFSRDETHHMAQTCGCTQEEYDRKVEDYYRSRGVAWSTAGGSRRLYVDIPKEVQRNRPRVRELAAALDHLATGRQYGPDETLGAVITFVQAALLYKKPPDEEGERDILGFFPPPRSLAEGYGDCDSKSALLAAILTNFPGIKMIGVHIPRHYLVGIARMPRPGDAFIEYGGEPFVLIEPAGPGRLPPGTVAASTQAALATMNEVRIDPLF